MSEGMEDRFEVDDFVFAKLKGHPHWPATISQIETLYANGNGQEKTRYNVYFYGSHQMSMIKVDSILRFEEHYEIFKKRYANNPKFSFALGELEAHKEVRENYMKSLQGGSVDTRFDVPQEKPDDEMFSSIEESSDDENGVTSVDAHSPTSSSGFGDNFDSDEEYQALRNQKYEILSMEKVPYEGSTDFLLVISLSFKEEDLQEDFQAIKEELRMMTCFVKLDRLGYVPVPKNRLNSGPRGPRGPYKKRMKMIEQPVEKPETVEKPGTVEKPEKAAVSSEGFPGRKRRRRKWKRGKWGSASKPSLTVLAAEAVKRRRRPNKRKTVFRDETRLLSLRQRTIDAAQKEGVSEGTCYCPTEKCTCAVAKPSAIICPICHAQFSSSVDYKQHSFNIHIMGL